MKKMLLWLAMIVPAICFATEAKTVGDSIKINNEFYAVPIPDDVFASMQGKSFKADCTVPRSDLRYVCVEICNAQGKPQKGELIVSKDIAKDIVEIFYDLFNIGYRIERMELIDKYDALDGPSMEANNSSAFNFRMKVGRDEISKHALGLAIDINPLYNPWVKVRPDGTIAVDPEIGRPYADRTADFPYKIDADDPAVMIFKQHGFQWGGDWTTHKDYQHFEK